MATSNNIGVVVYVVGNGHLQPIGARKLSRNIGYPTLVSLLHQVTGIDRKQFTLKISAVMFENNKSQLIPINNDDDLWFFCSPDAEDRNVNVLVEKKEVQTNAIPTIPQSNVGGVKRVHKTVMSSRSVLHETWPRSVKKLPKLMGAIQKWNPGSVVEWYHTINLSSGVNMLKYMFWAFKACIDGLQYCRRVVCVDAIHLCTKYKHKILTAISIDANQDIMPLAFALVDEETYDSWRWFLDMLSKHVVGGVVGMCLISSTNEGLLQAVKHVSDFQPSRGVHRLCLRCVCSDFNGKMENNLQLKYLCWTAGSTNEIAVFEELMRQIKALSEDAHNYLTQMDKRQWAVAHDGGWRCGVLTTKLSEYMSGVLKDVQHFPICKFVQVTFDRCNKYFHDQLEMACVMKQRNQPWPDVACRIYEQMEMESTRQQVYMSNPIEQTSLVREFIPQTMAWTEYIVKLKHRDCTCGFWKQNNIPCSHAILTCHDLGVDPASFMNLFYDISAYIETYSGKFMALPAEIYWDEPSFELCHNPALREDIPGRKTRKGKGSSMNIEINLGSGQQNQALEEVVSQAVIISIDDDDV